INETICTKGIDDAMTGKQLLIDEAQCNNVVMAYLNSLKTKPAVPAVIKKSGGNSLLKTVKDSVDYAIGMSVASFYKIQGVQSMNSKLVTKTVNDVLMGKKLLFNDDQMAAVINNYLNRIQVWKSKPNIQMGERFLAQNK